MNVKHISKDSWEGEEQKRNWASGTSVAALVISTLFSLENHGEELRVTKTNVSALSFSLSQSHKPNFL